MYLAIKYTMDNRSTIKYLILIGLSLIIFSNLKAQDYKRTAWWYFGNKAGLHFTDTGVFSDSNSKLNTIEGCATLSDTNGNLLLYTDGKSIWNRNHQLMLNGTGLLGDASTVQNSIIIPIDNNDSLFYIFTLDGGSGIGKGLNYNVVDITYHDTGLVILKNQFLTDELTEKMTVTKHSNERDYWLMVQKKQVDLIYFYLIKDGNLITCPIKNFIGFADYGGGANAKFSPDGKLLAVCNLQNGFNSFELYNFDNLSGRLSKRLLIDNVSRWIYNIEFSSDSKYLYASERENSILKYSLNEYDENKIKTSKKIIYTTSGGQIQGLQLGIDSNIYYSYVNKKYIGAIKNVSNNNTYFDTTYIDLSPRQASYGLLNFVTSYFYRPKVDFSYQQECNNPTIEFKEKYNTSYSAITWNIYKDSTLIQSYSTSNPTHTFSDTGIYEVQLIIDSDTAKKQVYLEPDIFRFPYLISCNNDSFKLEIPDNFRCIMWDNGSNAQDSIITQQSLYKISAYNRMGCYVTDSVTVLFVNKGKPNINRLNDSLFTDSIADFYTWYKDGIEMPNSNEQGIKISDTGVYSVKVEDFIGCPNTSDGFEVKCQTQKPNIRRDADTLFTDTLADAYIWFNGNKLLGIGNIPKIQITDTGDYLVKIINAFGCEDSSVVYTIDCKNNTIPNIRRTGKDSLITDSTGLKYTWYKSNTEIPNSNKPSIKTTENGIYKVLIEHKFGCQTGSVDFNVNYLSVGSFENSNIRIYPNPTISEISIVGIENQTLIEVSDITGKKIIEKYIDKNENRIGLLDFGQGIYILRINHQNFKILKQ